MLTPQEMQDKKFAKAVFGGYDMSEVDDFLDAVSADYEKLYKENAVLKGKLKVLAETVEEYRSVDDAMRQTLLNAQNMAAKVLEDAKKQSTEMTEKTSPLPASQRDKACSHAAEFLQKRQQNKRLQSAEHCFYILPCRTSFPKRAAQPVQQTAPLPKEFPAAHRYTHSPLSKL